MTTPALRHLTIELDGRRVQLGLPADLLRGLAAGAAAGAQGAEGSRDLWSGTHADASPVASPALDPAVVDAPMSGLLQAWKVEEGAEVEAGQLIAILEAMKMETQVLAHRSGRVSRLAAEGTAVTAQQALARIV